jgi:Ca2+-dependent lipid-binding protein
MNATIAAATFEEGALKVAVLKGRNLMMKDPKLLINAVVTITLADEDYATEAQSGSLNPDWNQVFGFSIVQVCLEQFTCHFFFGW